jgi:hypothetical protein
VGTFPAPEKLADTCCLIAGVILNTLKVLEHFCVGSGTELARVLA